MDVAASRGAPSPPGDGAPVSHLPAAAPRLADLAVAHAVSTFYETHPYPPPVGDLDAYRRAWNEARRRADACLFWPTQPFREDRRILVAGCGTSQAARYAVRWPHALVTGIDVSHASLEQTRRLKEQHRLDNLELYALPVERTGDLGCEFDHIVCTGVLHHLPDPGHGLRALRDVLSRDGAMHLMVYAPYGRAGVYMLQDYCRRLGIGTGTEEIHELAAALGTLPPQHPLSPLLRNARDFHTEAGLADALLHPRDRAYSVPQLFDLLAGCDVAFGRWLRQAEYVPHCGLLASSPHHPRLAMLPEQEQYAAAELFRGSMVHHSFVAYRSDCSDRQQPSFDGEGWLDYVPTRLPDTIVVQKNLPAGADAVLINRSHTCTDLYLPVNARQKELFDSVDGTRTIRSIAPDDAAVPIVRRLFEQLWQYDHVVFARRGDAGDRAVAGNFGMSAPEGTRP